MQHFLAVIALLGVMATIGIWADAHDFSCSVDPMRIYIDQGSTDKTFVKLDYGYLYDKNVNLRSESLPPNIKVQFEPEKLKHGENSISTVTISIEKEASLGEHLISIIGSGSDGKEHLCKLIINVTKSTQTPPPTVTTPPSPTVTTPPSPTVTPEKSYTEWWSEGDILYKKGDYLGAVDCYNKAIELAPNNAELWNAKGYAFKEMGERDQTNSKSEQAKDKYQQAIIAFDEALKLSNFNFQDAQDGKDFCQKQLSSLP